jgi:hypothetical protein
MNLRKKARKKIQKPRVSKYIHLWPELEFMPGLDHWPKRPDIYQPEDSEVLRFLVAGFGTTMEDADRIFHAAASKGVIKFNTTTRLWHGRKGGLP